MNISVHIIPSFSNAVRDHLSYHKRTRTISLLLVGMPASFDTTTALAALLLWIMFNYLQEMLNCDVQRLLRNNALARNVLGLIAFFFLFTVIDPNNDSHVGYTFLKTVLVYLLFMMAIKSRMIFIGIVLMLLLVDQVIRNHIAYLQKRGELDKVAYWVRVRGNIFWACVGVILVGMIDYLFKKKKEYGDRFDLTMFMFGTRGCKTN